MLRNTYRGVYRDFCKTVRKTTPGCSEVPALESVSGSIRVRFGDCFGTVPGHFGSVSADWAATTEHRLSMFRAESRMKLKLCLISSGMKIVVLLKEETGDTFSSLGQDCTVLIIN